jgi:hypothetical protein
MKKAPHGGAGGACELLVLFVVQRMRKSTGPPQQEWWCR